MIGDVSGIRGSGTDIDEGGAGVVGLHDVPSWHPGHAFRWCASGSGIGKPCITCKHVTWLYEDITIQITGPHTLAAHNCKGIGVKLVIGQDHEILEVLGIGARIVVQSVK